MLKLIASDLDGTLLDDKKSLPNDFGLLLDNLAQKGILFATGSGRTYITQKALFAEYCKEMVFICDNGAYIVENNITTFVSVINDDEWKRTVIFIESNIPEAATILCGINGTYCKDYRKSKAVSEILSVTYVGLEFVDNLIDVSDSIFKISVCHPYTAKETLLPKLSEYCTGKIKALHTDPSFVDVMNSDVSKGRAIEFLQLKHNISKSETMVFGDYYNDVEMLRQADLSYIMENSPIDMRKHGKYLAPSNNNFGVAAVINDYLKNER